MKIGIIAEFNPFHNGHEHLIKYAKKNGDTVICTISGNFVQRGDTAIFDKRIRTAAAIKAGADIVVETPVLWSMSTAQNFALCSVWQLYNMNCEKIVFGGCGDINRLLKTAEILESDGCFALISEYLKQGITYAVAREAAAKELGADTKLLKSPNDNLGIEYILAAKKLKLNIGFECVKRQGSGHDSELPEGGFASGSYIRNLILKGDFNTAKKYMPDYVSFEKEDVSDILRAERAILALLRTKTQEDFKNLPDLSEGIENRLFEAVKEAKTLNGLCEAVKTKRYTLSRVRRLVLAAALGAQKEFFMQVPPYTRILGASKGGISALKGIITLTPAVVKVSDIARLGKEAQAVFDFECKATDLYALSFDVPKSCGLEQKMKFIKEK